MNMPSFTAERSIYESRGRYSIATTFASQNASTSVQPALTHYGACLGILGGHFQAAYDRDAGWLAFWDAAWEGLGCNIY
jgi:hypothetical protein